MRERFEPLLNESKPSFVGRSLFIPEVFPNNLGVTSDLSELLSSKAFIVVPLSLVRLYG